MPSSPSNLFTTYGPLGLSALVILGLLVGWLLGRIDFGTAIGIIGTILAANGIVGVGMKATLIATMAPQARATSEEQDK